MMTGFLGDWSFDWTLFVQSPGQAFSGKSSRGGSVHGLYEARVLAVETNWGSLGVSGWMIFVGHGWIFLGLFGQVESQFVPRSDSGLTSQAWRLRMCGFLGLFILLKLVFLFCFRKHFFLNPPKARYLSLGFLCQSSRLPHSSKIHLSRLRLTRHAPFGCSVAASQEICGSISIDLCARRSTWRVI